MAKVDSRGARDRLPVRRDPYWQRVEVGLYVGYRTSEIGGDGTWRGRWRDEDGKQHYRTVDAAEFNPDPPGRDSMFSQAVKLIREWQAALAVGVVNKPSTVADAVDEYLRNKKRDTDPRSVRATEKAEAAFQRHVLSDPIAKVELARLKTTALESWLDRRVVPRGDADDPEVMRAARNTANRELARLKAVLNFALKKRLVSSDFAWRGVDKFANTSGRREYVPSDKEMGQLLVVAEPEMVRLIRILDMTGLRVGEVYRLRAADFDREAGTVRVSADTKTGKPRVVPVSSEAVVFLSGLAAERIGKALLFTRGDGVAWDGNEAAKRFRELRNTLGLSNDLVLYCVRHRWISRACGQMEIG